MAKGKSASRALTQRLFGMMSNSDTLAERLAAAKRHAGRRRIQCALETDWLADETVPFEPVSASKFPANREINKEIRCLGLGSADSAPNQRETSIAFG
jgi:hypothetical protein